MKKQQLIIHSCIHRPVYRRIRNKGDERKQRDQNQSNYIVVKYSTHHVRIVQNFSFLGWARLQQLTRNPNKVLMFWHSDKGKATQHTKELEEFFLYPTRYRCNSGALSLFYPTLFYFFFGLYKYKMLNGTTKCPPHFVKTLL